MKISLYRGGGREGEEEEEEEEEELDHRRHAMTIYCNVMLQLSTVDVGCNKVARTASGLVQESQIVYGC